MLLLLPLALADAIGPPPEDCPPGTRPTSTHHGGFCIVADICEVDSDCEDGTCQDVGLCAFETTLTRSCSNGIPHCPQTSNFEEADLACEVHEDCPDTPCDIAQRCVVEPDTGFAIYRPSNLGTAALGAALLGFAVISRRSRRDGEAP